MEYQPEWNTSLSEALQQIDSDQNPFQIPLSNHFRNPARIGKTGSQNNSPRRLGRRKTTSIPASRSKPAFDLHRVSLQQWPEQTVQRPSSWHTNAFNETNHPTHGFSNQPEVPITPYTTTTINGLITPMTYPLPDEPQIQELITPLEELSANQIQYGYQNGYECNVGQTWFLQDKQKSVPYFVHGLFDTDHVTQQFMSANGQNPIITEMPTAPSSPNFLPIQNDLDSSPLMLDISTLDMRPNNDELVGMGLYDSPAEVQSTSLFSGGITPSIRARKSLKLEDSFEPTSDSNEPEEEEDDDDYENDDAAGDDDDDNDGENNLDDNVDNSEDLIIQTNNGFDFPMYYPDQFSNTHGLGNLSGQTFYFDHDIPNDQMVYPSDGSYIPTTNYMTNNGFMVPISTSYPTNHDAYGWV